MSIDPNPQGMAMVLVHIPRAVVSIKDVAGKKRGGGGQTNSSGSGDGDLVDDDGDRSESHNVLGCQVGCCGQWLGADMPGSPCLTYEN